MKEQARIHERIRLMAPGGVLSRSDQVDMIGVQGPDVSAPWLPPLLARLGACPNIGTIAGLLRSGSMRSV